MELLLHGIYSINNNPSTAIIDASNCYESEFPWGFYYKRKSK